MLPPIAKPRILDVGCGSGVPTLELARISGGDIAAIDVDKDALDRLVDRAAQEGLSGRITVVQVSMLDMVFPPGSFDIIWAEGAISFIGFERGLREWRDLLVHGGHLVVHDTLADVRAKMEMTVACGYTIVGQFELPPSVWWNEYYAPLREQLETLEARGPASGRLASEVKAAGREIEAFHSGDSRYGSVFFVLKKA